jgi:hypothetical protein
MQNISGRAVAAAVGALATAFISIGPAAAADVDEIPPPEYSAPETYSGETFIEEDYVYPPPPPVYGYVAPPPVVYYAYRPPAIVVPPPYYVRRPYPYRAPAYVVRRPGPYVVRGVGPDRWGRRVNRW